MASTFSGDETAPFFGFLGAAAALVFSCKFFLNLVAMRHGSIGLILFIIVFKDVILVWPLIESDLRWEFNRDNGLWGSVDGDESFVIDQFGDDVC